MFRKLRNKLVLINASITSVVVLTVFSTIYLVYMNSANNRPPIPEDITMQTSTINYGEEVERIITFTVHEEKQAAAKNLLITLIASGAAIEIAVILVSYFMAEQSIEPIKEAYEAQKVFIANASHEIKTPLAAISANLEAADLKNNKWIKNVETETDKLTRLNNQLLTLARTDLMSTTAEEDTDLAKVLSQALESFSPRLKNLTFTSKIIKTEKIKINREDFLQIFSILMDNAIKYAGTKIKLELKPHELTLENDGTTIAPDKLPHIFDRFYQADKTSDGVGLGLSIAKSLAERNHWHLTASSGTTTRFTLQF